MQSADVCDAWEEVQGLVKERFSVFFGGALCAIGLESGCRSKYIIHHAAVFVSRQRLVTRHIIEMYSTKKTYKLYGCFKKIGGKHPKWMVYFMENPIKHGMIWGFSHIFGNIHMYNFS